MTLLSVDVENFVKEVVGDKLFDDEDEDEDEESLDPLKLRSTDDVAFAHDVELCDVTFCEAKYFWISFITIAVAFFRCSRAA
jgi:hypothetical protein